MIIYFDKQCERLIYRININGKPEEFISLNLVIEALRGQHEQA